jgi:hypothetical protein
MACTLPELVYTTGARAAPGRSGQQETLLLLDVYITGNELHCT